MTRTDEATLSTLLVGARSQNGWRDNSVDDADLRAAYEIARWGPTSMNTQPMRLLFLRSAEAKARLKPALMPGNVDKAMTAPVIAVIAYDTAFHAHLPVTFPHNPGARAFFEGKDALIQDTAFRNGTLQGAYFILALRAVGLDVGPMSGFTAPLVDAEFFAGTTYRTNFLCGVGHGDTAKVFPRAPRLHFEQVAEII